MSTKHNEEIVSSDNSSFFVKVPRQYFWKIVVVLFLGYTPTKDFLTGVFPVRGTEALKTYNEQTLRDDKSIITGLESGRQMNSNNIVLLSASIATLSKSQELFHQEIRDTLKEVKSDIRDLNTRLDNFKK